MFYWTAEPTTAQGPRKGELSSASMRHRLRPQPARLVRGSSRRIMTMRFRPANIRVINRRICSWDDHRPYCPKQNTLKAHQRERVPATPPVDWSWGARTVLTVKGSFCRAKKRRALTTARRSGRTIVAAGGSGGNTLRPCTRPKTKGRLPSCGGKPARKQNKTKPVRPGRA